MQLTGLVGFVITLFIMLEFPTTEPPFLLAAFVITSAALFIAGTPTVTTTAYTLVMILILGLPLFVDPTPETQVTWEIVREYFCMSLGMFILTWVKELLLNKEPK